jgi:hypothetical protein
VDGCRSRAADGDKERQERSYASHVCSYERAAGYAMIGFASDVGRGGKCELVENEISNVASLLACTLF